MRRAYQFVLAGVTLFLFLLTFLNSGFRLPNSSTNPVTAPKDLPVHSQVIRPGGAFSEFLFCFWNVENLFDDQNDRRTGRGDTEYDVWFSSQPEMLKLKLSNLCNAILSMNDNKGPDILALCEIEDLRAAELLMNALNQQMPSSAFHYRELIMKEVAVGRHIAPAILSRVPVVRDRTRLLDKRYRILEAQFVANNKNLTVFVSHWTSRMQENGDDQRDKYADKIYGECYAMTKSNPNADILVCGDFNDNPSDESVVKHLRATGNSQTLKADPLSMLNLFANKDQRTTGTLFYNRAWNLFDQIVVSPGMLDTNGWSCDPASAQIYARTYEASDPNRAPWRFGGPTDVGPRGFSDHFPVTVRLKVQ